ncbi:dienelactone hydrolase family protein [Algihabitans albus]|uniref:dienelactone hydrolase family protein n=1 Tax=Algihabitans albus TaxID=2164067 RepID=UPI0013C35CBF|nr:dienelactone hydrolase family protein [Algihabitans albus]
MPHRLLALLLPILLLGFFTDARPTAAAEPRLPALWPDLDDLGGPDGTAIAFPSSSPYTLADAASAPPEEAVGRLYLPQEASADAPVPAVVLLHGAGGVISTREPTYARQLASLGVAALVVDSFAARRDRAAGFVERLLEITEVMLVADAYAALAYLESRPEVDADRVVLTGFSYGGMASTFALYSQVAEALSLNGRRFAGHVAFYAPCIARFARTETTGAPLLMLWGDGDAIVDPDRCAEIAGDLEAGGSSVERIVYPGAVHQWDGRFQGPRTIGRNLAPCSFRVDEDGVAWDRSTFLPMLNRLLRQTSLGLCTDSGGYMIGRDDAVRSRSNADFATFLEQVFFATR